MVEGKEPVVLLLLMEKASNGDVPVDAPKPDLAAGLGARAAKPPPADPKTGAEPPEPNAAVPLDDPNAAVDDPNAELPCFPKANGWAGVVLPLSVDGCPKDEDPNDACLSLGFAGAAAPLPNGTGAFKDIGGYADEPTGFEGAGELALPHPKGVGAFEEMGG
jgi:hypothetical protein